MTETLEELLKRCTVKLVISNTSWGTGFLVTPDQILTCAHVVKKVVDQSESFVLVYLHKDNNPQEATIEQIVESCDLALLKLNSPVENLSCFGLDGQESQPNDGLYIYGYPDNYLNGAPVTVTYEGLTGDNPPLLKFKLGQIRPGLSGSPILNTRTKKVCGMVKSTRDRSYDLGGGGIPMSVILSQFKDFIGQGELPSGERYVEYPEIERIYRQEIIKDGALIRIKAPQKMGKTQLMERILNFARQQNYQTVRLDLDALDNSYRKDSKIGRWLCQQVGSELNLEDRTEDYWKRNITPNDKCHKYFQDYLLTKITDPLVLGIRNIDRLFSADCRNFFGLLRSWHNSGNVGNNPWKNLKQILVYSTEKIPNFGPYGSPFNVGVEIPIGDFSAEQVIKLAQSYKLRLTQEQLEEIMNLIGGNPFLINQLIKHLHDYPEESLEEILDKAPTDEGIYYNHFFHYWQILESQQLLECWKKIVNASSPIKILPKDSYILESIGLIRKQNNYVEPRYQLYRKYFHERL